VNTEELYVGQTFKNYKELCLELGWEIKKSANSKNAQFKELECYCKFNKIGHKITIEEVFETPHEKVESRGKSSIYGNLTQILITDLLAQCNGHISISKSKLMFTIGMVNTNYSECRELVPKLSKYTDIDENFIYDFYNTTIGSFRSIIETALKNLMDKRIIMYNTIIKVSEQGKYNTRNATERELQLIMSIEKDILDEMGYTHISNVRVSKDWKRFRTKAKQLLNERSDVEYYFTAYDITVNEKYIKEERKQLMDLVLEEMHRKESKSELNQIIYSNVILNAEKRHENGFTSGKKAKTRLNIFYVENIRELANLLIDKNTPNIIHKIRNIETEENILPLQLINEIDGLDELFG
jgi:hypothetical protein